MKHLYKDIEGESSYQECNRKYVVKMAPKQFFESDSRSIDQKNILESIKNFLDAFYMLCTPSSIIPSVLFNISTCLVSVEKLSDISPPLFIGMLQVVVPFLFIHTYLQGINQLCDVEIDKINKPYLPLVSGKMSFTTGVIIVASSLILSLWLGWIVGSWPSIWFRILNAMLWTAYSVNVPLLRWKKYPMLNAMVHVVSLALITPIGNFLHMQDIPDIEGDQAFGVQTFAIRLGQKRVFWISIFLLEMAYGVALLMGATSFFLWSKIVTVLGHAVLAFVVLYHAKSIDLRSKDSITSFYLLIFKLMGLEFFLLPLVR